ncbi:MAG: hypothetical protein RhofKO_42340 [Rhodothermales bacterium]
MSLLEFFRGEPAALVEQSRADLVEMLRVAQQMFEAAAVAVHNAEAPALDLDVADEEVNRREQQVRRALLQHVATNPSTDLPHSLTLISVVQDAERCGDLAKSLAKAAVLTDQRTATMRFAELGTAMSGVTMLFPMVQAAFESDDKAQAEAAMSAAQQIKTQTLGLVGALVRGGDGLDVPQAVLLATAARIVSRVAAHLSSIASVMVMPFDQIRRTPDWHDDE